MTVPEAINDAVAALLPCPSCKAKRAAICREECSGSWVYCQQCQHCGPFVGVTEEAGVVEAARLWNERAAGGIIA